MQLSKLCMLCLLMLALSCKKEGIPGCTDPDSSSYDPTATEDDGSCAYVRDKFVGFWKGSADCSKDIFDDFNFEIQIGLVEKTKDMINLNFICCSQLAFTGVVIDENTITIDFKKFINVFPNRCNSPTVTTISNGNYHLRGTLHLVDNRLIGNNIFNALLDEMDNNLCSYTCNFVLTKS